MITLHFILWYSTHNIRTISSFTTGYKGKVHPCTGTEALYMPYGP